MVLVLPGPQIEGPGLRKLKPGGGTENQDSAYVRAMSASFPGVAVCRTTL